MKQIQTIRKDLTKGSAAACVIAAGVCWGIIGVFSRQLAAGGFSPVQITQARCLVTACGMFVLLFFTGREKLRIRLRDIWYFLGTGICSIVFFNICYFKTISLTTLSAASVLLYTAPSFVILLSAVVFGEKIERRKVCCLLLAFGGCVLITGVLGEGKGALTAVGILTGLGAGFGYALYSIFGGLALRRYTTETVTFYTFLVASASLLPFSSVSELAGTTAEQPQLIWFVLLLGLASTMLPFLLYTRGLTGMEAGRASVMAFLEPLVSTITGIVIFGEKMTAGNLAGMILIFLSVLLLNIHTGTVNRIQKEKTA